jgi:hypothetical protein
VALSVLGIICSNLDLCVFTCSVTSFSVLQFGAVAVNDHYGFQHPAMLLFSSCVMYHHHHVSASLLNSANTCKLHMWCQIGSMHTSQ